MERQYHGKPATERRIKKAMNGIGSFLTAIPNFLNGEVVILSGTILFSK